MDLSEYKDLYLKTAADLLSQLHTDLAVWTKHPDEPELIERLHRNAHSLKGQSLVMEYQSTGLLAKELEYIFRAVKDKQLVPNEQLNHALADSLQKLYDSLENIKTHNTELDLTTEKTTLQQVSGISS